MPPKMTSRVDSLEAKIAALEDSIKLSMVEFQEAPLLEMTKLPDQRPSDEGNSGSCGWGGLTKGCGSSIPGGGGPCYPVEITWRNIGWQQGRWRCPC